MNLESPESVIYDKKRDVLYVSIFNIKEGFISKGDNTADEFISKVTINGTIEELHWIIGLISPTGMSMYKDKLYVVERSSLAEIDINTQKITNRYSIPNPDFPNDLIFDSNGIEYISDNGFIAILFGT